MRVSSFFFCFFIVVLLAKYYRKRCTLDTLYIRLSQKFLSFYKEIIDAQHLLFYIILLNYV